MSAPRGPANPTAWCAGLLAVAALAAGSSSLAEPSKGALDRAIDRVAADNAAAAKAQEKVSEASDNAEDLLHRYRAVRRRTEALVAYDEQLEEMLESQRAEVASLERQIDEVTTISRQITPLMRKMLAALSEFVELDVPFLLDERRGRIQGLHELFRRADVEESEKYRRLMEAYQIENEYGRTIEAYRASVKEGGKERTVDFLRVGRVVLLYRTIDGKSGARWDQRGRKWAPLSKQELIDLPKAFRIARKQAAPDLIRLPVPAPEVVK